MPFSFLKSSISTEVPDDIFISYSRVDGGHYARGIALSLSERGFTCFCDLLGTDASSDLPQSLLQKIRLCKTFILLGSPGAIEHPEHIAAEVSEFKNSHDTSRIIPISFGGETGGPGWSNAKWFEDVKGKALELEDAGALKSGKPSDAIVEGIDTTFNYIKIKHATRMELEQARVRRRRIVITSASIFAAALISVAVALYQRRLAVAEAMIARTQAAQAQDAETTAIQLRQQAVEQANAADVRRKAAEESAKSAEQSAKSAEASAKAAEQRRLTAEQQAATQESIADSRALANASQMILRQHPEDFTRSLSVAINALNRFQTVEANAAVRASLGLVPRVIRTVSYGENVRHTAFSPDGKHFAMLLSSTKLQLYRTGEQAPLKEMPCDDCFRVALSNDAKYAAVGLVTGEIKLLDLKNDGSHLIKAAPDSGMPISVLALSPNGRYLAVSYETPGARQTEASDVEVLECNSGKLITTLSKTLNMNVGDIAFGPTGDLAMGGSKAIVMGPSVGRVVVWSLSAKLQNGETGSELTDLDFSDFIDTNLESRASAIALGPDSFLLATDKGVWKRNGLRQYDPVVLIPSATTKKGPRQPYEVEKVVFNHDGSINVLRRVAIPLPIHPSASTARVNFIEKQLIEVLDATGHNEALSTNGTGFIYGMAFAPKDERVGVFSSAPKKATLSFYNAAHKTNIDPLEITPVRQFKGKVFASRDLGFTATAGERALSVRNVWNAKTFTAPYDRNLVSPDTVSFSRDGRSLVLVDAGEAGEYNSKTGNFDGARFATAFVYRSTGDSYSQIAKIRLDGVLKQDGMLKQISLSADGRYLAATTLKRDSSGSSIARIYSVVDERDVTFPALRKGNRVTWVEFSPDGRFLLAREETGVTRLSRVWEFANEKEIVKLNHEATSLFYRFSSGGRYLLVAGSDRSTTLVDLSTGRAKPIAEVTQAISAAFSPDEKYVGIADDINLLRVYRTDSLNEVTRIQHEERIAWVAFSYDNRYLATASSHLNTDRFGTMPRSFATFAEAADANDRMNDATENRLRVWFLRREDLIEAASSRINGLPAYAR